MDVEKLDFWQVDRMTARISGRQKTAPSNAHIQLHVIGGCDLGCNFLSHICCLPGALGCFSVETRQYLFFQGEHNTYLCCQNKGSEIKGQLKVSEIPPEQ